MKHKAFSIIVLAVLMAAFAATSATADITMTFEEFLGFDQEPIATFYTGVSFESGSGGSDWVARDATSNSYNVSSWPSMTQWNAGTYWEYDLVGATTALDYTGNDGVIRFDNADATYVELGYCAGSTLHLLAYDIDGNLLDQDSGPANRRYIEGNESGPGTLRVDWNGFDYIAFVSVQDSGNYWVVDNVTTDATGIQLSPCDECLEKIDLDFPKDGSVLTGPPEFCWSACGGTDDNIFAVDLLASPIGPVVRSFYLGKNAGADCYAMSQSNWDWIHDGKTVYWRVRGYDKWCDPKPVLVISDEVWSFTK